MIFQALPIIIALTLLGCSQQAWYNGVKQGAENECRYQPQSAMESCLDRLNKRSYEEYEQQRRGYRH